VFGYVVVVESKSWLKECLCVCLSVSVLSLCRSQYFSPLDDLAFDMYQDPDVAQVIRQLERKKHEAASSENTVLKYLFAEVALNKKK